ncbi:histidine phosphatase family protein [Shewanella aestuarii]|uniref:Histidine phosphatase family protein n=1 Tax=Shewanella aestuarii TaxID=1028752 RepID=A0A6G9QIV0_9GAMM|nr:histidine phosphatase family protein [Shewanella aestuarii]QIR14402.1 histidine phosphatase family protein [Shewanella aestuarii]
MINQKILTAVIVTALTALLQLTSYSSTAETLKVNQQQTHLNPIQASNDNQQISPAHWTFFLVRHAEKNKGADPELTPEGVKRANRLASMLQYIPLDKVYSTDYRRTEQTALPTANLNNLAVENYQASDLLSFSEQLLTTPGNYLVVGHSNTTPVLASYLSKHKTSKMDDLKSYDRLYVIEVFQMGLEKHATLKVISY